MGPFSWKNFRHRDSKSASTQVSSTERALRVKLICQAVRSGTYRVSTGELADRFLARMASGQLHTSS